MRKIRRVQTLRFEDVPPSVRHKYKLIPSQSNAKRDYKAVQMSRPQLNTRSLYTAIARSGSGKTRCRLGAFEDERVAALALSCAEADERFCVPYGLADALAEHEGDDYLSSSQPSSSPSSSSLSTSLTTKTITKTTTTTTTESKGKSRGKREGASDGDEGATDIVWLTSGSSYIGGERTSDKLKKERKSDSSEICAH